MSANILYVSQNALALTYKSGMRNMSNIFPTLNLKWKLYVIGSIAIPYYLFTFINIHNFSCCCWEYASSNNIQIQWFDGKTRNSPACSHTLCFVNKKVKIKTKTLRKNPTKLLVEKCGSDIFWFTLRNETSSFHLNSFIHMKLVILTTGNKGWMTAELKYLPVINVAL